MQNTSGVLILRTVRLILRACLKLIILSTLAGKALHSADNPVLQQKAAAQASRDIPEGAKLILSEDFSQNKLSAAWEIVQGYWKVEKQALKGERNAQIIFKAPIGSSNLRIEYSAWSDDPGDLSAFICPESYKGEKAEYFFGFGSKFNTENKIMAGSSTLAYQGGALEVYKKPIQTGEKHKIVVQRQNQKLQMLIDNEIILEADDENFSGRRGENFGFYIWNSGFIDDVKVYALPDLPRSDEDGEKAITYHLYDGFEVSQKEFEQKPAFELFGEGAFQEIVNYPTWIYRNPRGTEVVPDFCVKLRCGENGMTAMKTLPHLESALIEFDFMAEESSEINFSVLDQKDQPLIQLMIEEDGRFSSFDKNGKKYLREKISYQRRVFSADFRFMPGRWYTFRLLFTEKSREIILLNHYSETRDKFAKGMSGEYLPLMTEMVEEKFQPAAKLLFQGKGENTFLVDNLIVAAPIGNSNKIQGKDKNQNAAEIFELDFPPRKDPFYLKSASFRNITRSALRVTPMLQYFFRNYKSSPEYKLFRPFALRYNQALINLAFLRESIDMLQRSAIYLGNSAIGDNLNKTLIKLEASYAQAESLQEENLQFYAENYLDAQLGSRLDRLDNLLNEAVVLQAKIKTMLDEALSQIQSVSGGKDVFPCPSVGVEGEIVWNPSLKRWEQNAQPVVFHYMSHGPGEPFYWDDLKMLGFANYRDAGSGYKSFPFRPDVDEPLTEEGIFINRNDGNWKWLKSLHDSGRAGLMMITPGLNYAATSAPQWWIQKFYDNDEIFFTNGTVPADKKAVWHGRYALNWWHPEVKKMLDEQFSALSLEIAKYKKAISVLQLGWELTNRFPNGIKPELTPGVDKIFQQLLERKYANIAELNLCWNSEYKNFSEIVPGKKTLDPSGVQYEFQKFLHDGFSSWLKRIHDALDKHQTAIPTATDAQVTLAEDPLALFRAIDIKLYHTYQSWDRKLVDRWHAQLGAVLGTPFGTKEWIPSQGSPCMFEFDRIRNSSLREKSMLMIWGGTMMEFYGWGGGAWQYDSGFHDFRLDRLIFNYVAPIYPIYMDRIRRMGSYALTVPLAKPEIGLLEVSSARYNACKVHTGLRALATELAENSWDFEFLYEQLLIENVQKLQGIKVLIIPAGICMPEELFRLIDNWVQAGGILICTDGPAGLLTQYGQKTERMKSIFAQARRQYKSSGKWFFPDTALFYDGKEDKGWKWDYGLGRIYIFDQVYGNFLHHLSKITAKQFGSESLELQFCLREDSTGKYLYVLNWSDQQVVAADIFICGEYDKVLDLGLQVPLAVPAQYATGQTVFPCRLAPGEVTLYKILQTGK